MDLEEKKYWVAFNVFEGIGPARFKLLLDYFGSAKTAFYATQSQLTQIGLGDKLVGKFINFRKNIFDKDSYLLRLNKLGIEIICSVEESYPKMLKEIEGKPPVIYAKVRDLGDLRVLGKKAVAVVGTRKVTSYGRRVTEMITEGLVSAGLVIVSGLARGVDRIAHETALNNGGLTMAVLGCGLDLIYPPEHKDLANRIINSNGAIMSEFPLGMQAVPGNFPARNRIISGLSLGVVVTEAAEDSGSLITASCAAEQGREVFAVPGPITSPLSKGTSELIKKGAKLVSGVEDILEEIGVRGLRPAFAPPIRRASAGKDLGELGVLGDEERKIVDLLVNENLTVDEIIRKLQSDSGKIGSLLSMMEIKGIVKNYGEGVYGLK